MLRRLFSSALFCGSVLLPASARAQACVTCWTDSCKNLKSYGRPACPKKSGAIPEGTPSDSPTAGTSRKDEKTGLAWIYVPAGTFNMGCVTGDSQCSDGEKPPHSQSVDKFWMNVTDIKAGAFKKCVTAGSCAAPSVEELKCNYGRRPDHPMNCVSWEQAKAFCGWAGGRLPTAAEWEYAARSGRDVIYPWGNDPVTGVRANFCDVNCAVDSGTRKDLQKKGQIDESQDDGWSTTSPVGSYPSGDTPWGLKDMAGNVSQWTESRFDGKSIELRGSSWLAGPHDLRTSHRGQSSPAEGESGIGFRCVQ